jgi:hypothetical protein
MALRPHVTVGLPDMSAERTFFGNQRATDSAETIAHAICASNAAGAGCDARKGAWVLNGDDYAGNACAVPYARSRFRLSDFMSAADIVQMHPVGDVRDLSIFSRNQ